jgi:hypothetical protein
MNRTGCANNILARRLAKGQPPPFYPAKKTGPRPRADIITGGVYQPSRTGRFTIRTKKYGGEEASQSRMTFSLIVRKWETSNRQCITILSGQQTCEVILKPPRLETFPSNRSSSHCCTSGPARSRSSGYSSVIRNLHLTILPLCRNCKKQKEAVLPASTDSARFNLS